MSIRTEILGVAQTPPPLAEEIDRAYLEVFPNVGADGIDHRGVKYEGGAWRALVYYNEMWSAIAEVLERQIFLGGQPVTVGGVGGVMSLPDRRGLGLGKAALRAISEFICTEMKADAGMLYCSEHNIAFYELLGWQRLERNLTYHQHDGTHTIETKNDDNVMILPCGGFIFPAGDIDIKGTLW